MNTVIFDFSEINNYDEFYAALRSKMELPDFFENNLDALYDTITGYVKLPLEIEFVNMNLSQLDTFSGLVATLEEADEELDDFKFSYFVEQYDDIL